MIAVIIVNSFVFEMLIIAILNAFFLAIILFVFIAIFL